MKKSLLIVCLFAVMALQARTWTPSQVKDIIRKVNTYWQANNNAEVRAFWDNAAYHTGNIEVDKLFEEGGTRNEEGARMLDYSIRSPSSFLVPPSSKSLYTSMLPVW